MSLRRIVHTRQTLVRSHELVERLGIGETIVRGSPLQWGLEHLLEDERLPSSLGALEVASQFHHGVVLSAVRGDELRVEGTNIVHRGWLEARVAGQNLAIAIEESLLERYSRVLSVAMANRVLVGVRLRNEAAVPRNLHGRLRCPLHTTAMRSSHKPLCLTAPWSRAKVLTVLHSREATRCLWSGVLGLTVLQCVLSC